MSPQPGAQPTAVCLTRWRRVAWSLQIQSRFHKMYSPVYNSNEELVQLLTKYVNDPAGRATLQQRLCQQVLAQHGYMQRAFELRGRLARWTAKQGDHRQT